MALATEAIPSGDRQGLGRLCLLGLAVLLVVAMAISLTTGASGASALDVLARWLGVSAGDPTQAVRDETILVGIRLPRMVLGITVGAGLAVSGLVMQGLFRNPLADPALVGVSAGASLGAVCVIVLGTTALMAPAVGLLGVFALPAAAFLGGLATTFILYGIATRRGQTSVSTMLLAGIALGAMAAAATGVVIYLANDTQLRDLTFWTLGSLSGATWAKVMAATPIVAVALLAVGPLANGLNAITLGEATASHLGINVQRLKRVAIVAVAAATGASVAVSGSIGFVGIVVPHLLRLVIGPDHRYLIPASAMLGAIFMLFADAVSRVVVAPAELPIGIVTAMVGGPFFLWVLLSRNRGAQW